MAACACRCPCQKDIGYSWKDYYGVVPEDALPGGKDANGEDIYIGQVYVHEYGLFVCPLFRGQTKTEFPCYGIKTADSNIKILCANNEDDFRWLPTTSETLHVDTSNKQVVIGGFAAKVPGSYNIGRVTYEGMTQIGAVDAFRVENAWFWFCHKGKLSQVKKYQVLIYDRQRCEKCLSKP